VHVGSNSVSTPLHGRRLPAIFPKRCNAGARLWLLSAVLGFERCRSVWLARPALSLSDVVWNASIHPYGLVRMGSRSFRRACLL